MSLRLFLLDGMALAYRAHFAFSSFTSKGFNTSALFGFTNTLVSLIESHEPTHIAVAFDTAAPTQRHEAYQDYKANREEMPEDLSQALPHLRRFVDAFQVRMLSLDGYEADDIIGTLALQAEKEGFETFMVTPDKDYGQLVSEKTFLYRPSRQGDGAEIQRVKEVLERWEIERVDQVIDILGLAGDASDNIPGVPKIGLKTAQKLIAKYGTVENLLDHTHELKGKQKENVETYADQARLSKKLATIDRAVPLEFNLKDFQVGSPDKNKLHELFVEFEFRSMARRLLGEDFSPTPTPSVATDQESTDTSGKAATDLLPFPHLKTIDEVPHTYESVTGPQQRVDLIALLQKQPAFCFDTETTGLNPRTADIVGLAFSFEAHRGFFVHLSRDAGDAQSQLEAFKPLFADETIEKVGHNLQFDLAVLKRSGIDVGGPLFDTMLAHALTEPELKHGMDYLAETYLQYTPIPISKLIGDKEGGQKTMAEVGPQALTEYAVEDADITWQLREPLTQLLKDKQQVRVFYEVEAPLIRVLVDMQCEGISLDIDVLAQLSQRLGELIEEGRQYIFSTVGHEFNLDSPKQLGVVLFDELKLADKPRKTKTGQYATNEQALITLASKYEIVQRILDYRTAVKLKSTYVDSLPATVASDTGRVHTHYGQLHAATGRLQSSGPNLQNIPIRTELGREIRKAFKACDDDHVLLSVDYSQIELRIIAALSQDAGMLEALRTEQDIHTATAARVFDVPNDQVSREQRDRAKVVNFGIPYGISAFGLAQRLNIGRTEAAELIEQYFNQFPGIYDYIDRTLAFARENGYVETVMGRRRYLRDVNSANATTRAAAERNAINMPIQGTAADMIKIAMSRIHKALAERRLRTKMLLQVHDELVFEVHKSERATVGPLVEQAMVNAIDLGVPIVVEMGYGPNWLEAH